METDRRTERDDRAEDQEIDLEQRIGMDSRNLRRKAMQTAGKPQVCKDKKKERKGSKGRWKEKTVLRSVVGNARSLGD